MAKMTEKTDFRLKDSSEFDTKNIHAHSDLAWAYNNMGKYDLAEKEFKKAYGMYNKKFCIDKNYNSGMKRMINQTSKELIHKSPASYGENKKVNEAEIVQKKIVLNSMPTGLRITLSTRCNLRCRMCKTPYMPWETPKRVIGEIIKIFPYLDNVTWEGGRCFSWNILRIYLK